MSKFKLLNMLWLSLLGFSCGLANYVGSGGGSSNRSNQDSQVQVRGTFTSSQGRLTSKKTCADNPACVELCDSMLDRLSLQEDCYDLKEEEVQGLRDTYNKLVEHGGDLRQLSKVEPEELQTFLEFSPKLYESAIFGFRRGWKEDCQVKDLPPTDSRCPGHSRCYSDTRDREDCKLEDYYQQDGYHSEGASQALEWIASSNWLGELLLEHDEDFIVMLALLEILAEGGQYPLEDSDGDGNDDNSNDGDSVCKWSTAATSGSNPKHGRLNDDHSNAQTDFKNHFQAFGADCVELDSDNDNGKNYFMIAVEGDNPYSANLGHQVLREKLCRGGTTELTACLKDFYCNILGTDKEQIDNNWTNDLIKYMNDRDNSIKKFSNLPNCGSTEPPQR